MTNKKKDEITIHSSAAEYLTYIVAVGDNADSMEMRYEDENIWLTQRMLAQLYDISVLNIGQHIKKIYEDGELTQEATIKKFFIVQNEGSRQVDRAVRFHKWLGQIVKDYTIQGWTMDKERLKKGHMFTDEYFERQLQSIREIRLSERKFYQKITDLYATAFDYDKDADTVHGVKGETHTATLYVETYFDKKTDLERVLRFILDKDAEIRNDDERKSLKVAYVGMSRSTDLHCVTVSEETFSKYSKKLLDMEERKDIIIIYI